MSGANFDPIAYLISRRFGSHLALTALPPLTRPGQPCVERAIADDLQRKAESYRAELTATPPEILAALVENERAKEGQEWASRAQRQQMAPFYDRTAANADVAHWSKAAYWTFDEALALAFGKSPAVVTPATLASYSQMPGFPQQYAHARDLALRAKSVKLLQDKMAPSSFLAWARRNDIAVPEDLLKAVEARGEVVADWKDRYDHLKDQFDKLAAVAEAGGLKLQDALAERDTLSQHVDELNEKVSAWQFDELAENYPEELDVAMQAWWAASKRQRDPSISVRQQIQSWVEGNYPKLADEAKKRIATICNWEKRGGRRPGSL